MRFGIPVAVQADLAAARTATGAGLIALSGRGRGGGASDLLAYLRTPGVASPSKVDWFERRLLRGRLRTNGRRRSSLAARARTATRGCARSRSSARRAPEPRCCARPASQARWIAESALRRQGAVAGEDRALELRAGAEIERALAELGRARPPPHP